MARQMVDMRIVNAKLVRRAHRMLRHLTGCTQAQAEEALQQANGSIKLAVLLRHGLDVTQAQQLLALCGGHLRKALARIAAQTPAKAHA